MKKEVKNEVKDSKRRYQKKNIKYREKKCKICGKHFYLRGSNSKTCSDECQIENRRRNHNINSKIWNKRNHEQKKEIGRIYYMKNSKILAIKANEWRKKNPQKAIEQTNKWRKNNPKKRNAEARAQRNIKIPPGKLCEICKKNLATQRHHPDYSKPLDIVMLCTKCHVNLHLSEKNKR